MPGGRRTGLRIFLPQAWRRQLQTWQHTHSTPVGLARRGRVILLLADGVPVSHVARMVGLQRCHVYKWARRFLDLGIEGLVDRRTVKGPRQSTVAFHGRGGGHQESVLIL